MGKCRYCEDEKPIVKGQMGDISVAIQLPNKLVAYDYGIFGCDSVIVEINFCPMCGKKLKKQSPN